MTKRKLVQPGPREARDCVCYNLRKAARAVTQLYDEMLRPTGIRDPRSRRCTALDSGRARYSLEIGGRGAARNTRIVGVRTPGVTPILASRERGLVGLHSAAGSPGVDAS